MLEMGGSGVRIGKSNESHIEQDYHSLQFIDKNGNTYFHVSDLLERDGSVERTNSVTIKYTPYSQYRFALSAESSMPVRSITKVAIDGVETVDYTVYTINDRIWGIDLGTPITTQGAKLDVTFRSESPNLKAYTFGKRDSSSEIGVYSLAEGVGCTASGEYSHAEGMDCVASGYISHAEGYNTVASAPIDDDEGIYEGSHAEGSSTTASGNASHAEGCFTESSGWGSHAEGSSSVASGNSSHAQNLGTIAGYSSQTAIGRYNDNQLDNAFEIGNGTADDARSNAFAVTWDGLIVTTPSTADWTLATGVTSATTHGCRTNGVCLTIYGQNITLKSSLAVDSQVTIGTIPAEFRPPMPMHVPALSYQANVAGAIVQVTTSGDLILTNRSAAAIATSTRIAFSMTVTP